MKTGCVILALLLLLSGCTAGEVMETVADEPQMPVMAPVRDTMMELPPEAASPAVESDSGRLYLCSGYEISLQTLPGGDLDATVRTVSGYGVEELTVMQRQADGHRRYDFVWACAGESGEQVGRAAILDDGEYHYVLTVLGEADTARANRPAWVRMFQTFALA